MSKITIIGCGNMGFALLSGIVNSKKYAPESITAVDKSDFCRERAEKLGVKVSSEPAKACKEADLLILAVKPNALDALAEEIKGSIKPGCIIASILAGKTLNTLENIFGSGIGIIRIMPNTPALVGCGMSGACRNSNVSDEYFAEILDILSQMGQAREVDESLMDIVTGISGSGPAYGFMFIDGLMKAGEKRGLSPENAKLFAAQTMLGAAKMVLENDISPEQLKINVCSPGGTTIEAVKVFEDCGLYDIIDKAVDACTEKSKLMSK